MDPALAAPTLKLAGRAKGDAVAAAALDAARRSYAPTRPTRPGSSPAWRCSSRTARYSPDATRATRPTTRACRRWSRCWPSRT
ncbi:hypothetical protein [Oleiharenicola sp. Vm1]|uniref:hypothetical protein n=1 Tax=Oleiharenicola sp. Vm1 TaxID=3398393 RepID=UPI0039F4A416